MLLVVLLVNLALAPSVFAKTKGNKEAEFIEKLQANLQKQGVGVDSKIKVKLLDGTKLKGYISEINAERFTVVDEKTGQSVPVAYPQVKQAQGNNWNARRYIGLAVVIGIFVVLIVAVATAKD